MKPNRYMDGIRIAGWTSFLLYLALLAYLMFFADEWGRTSGSLTYSYNYTPFAEIRRYVIYWRQIGLERVVLNLGGNVAAFLPFGFFIPLLFRYHRSVWVITAWSFGVSVFIELTQLITRVGSCDIDDVLLNTLGGIIGYFLFIWLRDRRRERLRRNSNIGNNDIGL